VLTRARSTRIASGELSWTGLPLSRLYDLRAFKSAWAEYAYIYRLAAAGPFGGTAVTSMPQLVRGLGRYCHPSWQLTDDKFADRDRYHSAVRRRLRDLQAMGLLDWRIGIDDLGEERRTELVLRQVPELLPAELEAAVAQLAKWEHKRGAMLNTGSKTGVRDTPAIAAPLQPSERAARAIASAKQRSGAASRRTPKNNCAPHFVAPATPENCFVLSTNHVAPSGVVHRTGARTRQPNASDSCVTRASHTKDASVSAARSADVKTASPRTPGSGPPSGSATWQTELQERVAARLATRQPVWDLIAHQAQARAGDVASWTLDRGWPQGRLREAWVVWRYGSQCAGELGAAPAGHLAADDLQRLRRALARYERHRAVRPAVFPAGGLAVLAVIAAIADHTHSKPQTLHYAIRLLDQLSLRMRAIDTRDNPARRDSAAARARRRLLPAADGLMRMAFRTSSSPWPRWVALDDAGHPRLQDDELVFAAEPGIAGVPDRRDDSYLQTLRDAQLLAGMWPRAEADGRTAMADNPDNYDVQSAHRRARPGRYGPPPDRRGEADFADLRLAQLTAMPLNAVTQLSATMRDQLLEHHTARLASRRRDERDALWARLAALGSVSAALEHRRTATAARNATRRAPVQPVKQVSRRLA
jgi:hypothetical protein